jgi:hypothetical protein
MKQRALFVGVALGLVFVGSLSAQTLGAVLTGGQEVPPCATSGFGNATVTFDSARQNITVTITVANLGSPIIASHIHSGAAGVAGNVVLGFTPAASFSGGKLTGTFPITSDLGTQILQNPAGFYLNVHTTQCPDGAARGQLAFASGGVITYAAELRPQNEVPPATGNAFGSALVTFDFNNNTIAWEVNSSGVVSPTLSHIHRGSSAVTGSVIINFATSASQIVGGHTSGFATMSGSQVTAAFQPSDLTALANPATASNYYVNVHSSAFPGGEIRGPLVSVTGASGQAMPSLELDIPVAGHVTNGIGQTFVTDARVFNPSYDTPAVALLEFFQAGLAANTMATVSTVANIQPRGTAILNDIAGSSGLNVTGTGAIRVSSVSRLAATSRIFTTGNGTFGQFVAALNRVSAKRRGVIPQLSNTTQATGFRTNVGFFNPTTQIVTVRLDLRDSNGVIVGSNTNTITLQPLSQQQNAIGTYFPGVDLSNAANLTLSFDTSAQIFVYASVIDNTSGDSILVEAQDDTGVAANQ